MPGRPSRDSTRAPIGSQIAMIAGVLCATFIASALDQLKISTNVVPFSLCRLEPPTSASK
jgi:hypothetical protein